MPTTINAILAKNTCFTTLEELVVCMQTNNYHPSIRADEDPALLDVVAALEEHGLDKGCYVYFPRLDGTGIATCWGLPRKRLAELSAKPSLTKREAIEKRDLTGALTAPPSLPDHNGKPLYVGTRVNFPSGSASGGRRIGRVVKLGKTRVTVEYMFKSGRKAANKTVPAVDCFKV